MTEINCQCGAEDCFTRMVIRPLHDDSPVPLVELEIKGTSLLFLDEEGITDLYIKVLNALNVQPVPAEVAERYDYE
jgi:hypothetical protein